MLSEIEAKYLVAELIVGGKQPLEAVNEVFMSQGWNDPLTILRIAKEWPNDREVREEIKRLKSIVPTREQLALQLLDIRKNACHKDYNDLTKTAALLFGYLEKDNLNMSKKGQDRIDELFAACKR